MPERSATPLEFRGADAAECDTFISAVTAHALAEGKQHDDQWIADFASTCFTDASLRWWDSLDEKDQRSWKLLRRAMLSSFQPTFSGESGVKAEEFIRMVRRKAFEVGKHWDGTWMLGFASNCLAGDAMRWHASLDEATQSDWKLFWPALLARYPRDAPSDSLPSSTRKRGRIQVIKKTDRGTTYYVSKTPSTDEGDRVFLTVAAVEALEVEYDPTTTESQTLYIPGNQFQNCDRLGIKWLYVDTTRSNNWMGLVGVSSRPGNGAPRDKFAGPLSTNTWKISSTADGRGLRQLFGANGSGNLLPLSNPSYPNGIWFRVGPKLGEFDLELFLEPV